MSNYGSITVTLQVLFLHQVTAACGYFPKDCQTAIHYVTQKKPQRIIKNGVRRSDRLQRRDLPVGLCVPVCAPQILPGVFLTLLCKRGQVSTDLAKKIEKSDSKFHLHSLE